MTYLLDTNIFIQAKNLHYGFDFCPAFWDWLIASNNAQVVFSIAAAAQRLFPESLLRSVYLPICSFTQS